MLEEELQKLADATPPPITQEQAKLPDLGPLPPPTPEGSVHEDQEEEEDVEVDAEGEDEDEPEDEDEEDEEEEESAEEEEEDGGKPRLRRRRGGKKEDDGLNDSSSGGAMAKRAQQASDPRKKRGRPPKVDTPMESRIKAILKGLRRLKDEDGEPRHLNFDKLPDIKLFPEYYQEINTPIAVDGIKVKLVVLSSVYRVLMIAETSKTTRIPIRRPFHAGR